MFQYVVWTLNEDLLLLNVDLDLAELGIRQPDLYENAVAMVGGWVFVRETEEHVLCPEVLLL